MIFQVKMQRKKEEEKWWLKCHQELFILQPISAPLRAFVAIDVESHFTITVPHKTTFYYALLETVLVIFFPLFFISSNILSFVAITCTPTNQQAITYINYVHNTVDDHSFRDLQGAQSAPQDRSSGALIHILRRPLHFLLVPKTLRLSLSHYPWEYIFPSVHCPKI